MQPILRPEEKPDTIAGLGRHLNDGRGWCAMKSSLEIFGERIGKTPDEFTQTDWRKAAQTLACVIDTDHTDGRGDPALPQRIAEAFMQAVASKAKKRGRRPRWGVNMLAQLMYESRAYKPKPRGRPKGGALTIDVSDLSEFVDEALTPEMRKRFPDLPRTRRALIRRILVALGENPIWTESATRREREFRQKRKKIGNK